MSIIHGDAFEVLRGMPARSVDAIVTDPPSGIAFMGKAWDKPGALLAVAGAKLTKGQKFRAGITPIFIEGLRVLKPGGCAFVWALPRTSHWTATALEDAGFLIRDVLIHVQGQGMPKSRALLAPKSEHWILCRKPGPLRHLRIDECRVSTTDNLNGGAYAKDGGERHDGAENWRFKAGGGGEFQQPAGRWPANFVLSHCGPDSEGTGGCERVGVKRVASNGHHPARRGSAGLWSGQGGGLNGTEGGEAYTGIDGAETVLSYRCAEGCPVALLDAQSGVRRAGGHPSVRRADGKRAAYGAFPGGKNERIGVRNTTGTASRFFDCLEPDPFFYQAKASRKDRGEGNKHPTVKSTALMRHLCRLIAAPGELVLDMFCGSGSTGIAADAEGMRFIGIDQDAESVETARRRLAGKVQLGQATL